MIIFVATVFNTYVNMTSGTREDAVEAYATQINQDIENKRKIQHNKKHIKKLFDKKKHIDNSIDTSNDRNNTVISSRAGSLDPTPTVKSIPIYAFELQTNSEEWWLESELIKLNNDDTTTITLLIMDPQNDFHEGRGNEGDADYRPKGSLAVPGKHISFSSMLWKQAFNFFLFYVLQGL